MTIRNLATITLVLAVCLLPVSGQAVTFDWATVGDVGNGGDALNWAGYGGVDYECRISKTTVTNAQYVEFLNDVAASDPFKLYNSSMNADTRGGITRLGSPGTFSYVVKANAVGQGPGGSDYTYANKPVNFVSWFDTIRFANWLNSGTTESGAYTITGGGANSGVVTIPDHATLGAGTFYLPTENEWYKAAYYDGDTDTYYDFATGTDTTPDNNLPSADTGNSVNMYDGGDYTTGSHSYPLTDVGAYSLSASPYGTFDQSGNVWEFTESPINAADCVTRGGSWVNGDGYQDAQTRSNYTTYSEASNIGFRMAITADNVVPEPSTYAMAVLGLLGFAFYGWRRRIA